MSDKSFLAHFITEDIYVLKEELPKVEEAASAKEEVIPEPAPVVNEVTTEAPAPAETAAPEPTTAPAQPAESVAEAAPQQPDEAVEEETPALFEPLKVEEPAPVYLKPLPTLGKNLKHCLILVESEEKVLERDLMVLLGKILSSVNRAGEDILLVNVREASGEQIEALLTEQNHRHLLAFGTHKVEALMEVGNYEVVQLNKKYYIKADSLKAISEDVELKKVLWKALKEMF